MGCQCLATCNLDRLLTHITLGYSTAWHGLNTDRDGDKDKVDAVADNVPGP